MGVAAGSAWFTPYLQLVYGHAVAVAESAVYVRSASGWSEMSSTEMWSSVPYS